MEKVIVKESKSLVRPKISVDEAKKIVFDYYGLTVYKISKLNGYDDANFHILVEREVSNRFIDTIVESGYVLKIINTLDSQDPSVFEARTDLLLHLNKNNIRCPMPILTKDQKPFDKIQLSSGVHIVTLLEFIAGEIVFKIQGTSKLYFNVGVLVARMDNALETFDHPAYHKKIQWCLGSAPDILNYLDVIQDKVKQRMVKKIIQEFTEKVLAIEDRLCKGIIHGDINEQNLIVEQVNNQIHIKGIIDFGDTHYTCYLYELAIAMTYMIFTSNDVNIGGYVLAGYSSTRNVTEEELNLLRICVMTRFCQSLVLGAYASTQEPGNEYILTTAKKGWEILKAMSCMSEMEVLMRWKSADTDEDTLRTLANSEKNQ